MASCGSLQPLCHLRPISILVFLHRGGNQRHTSCSAAGPPQISSPRGEMQTSSIQYRLYTYISSWWSSFMHCNAEKITEQLFFLFLATHRNGFWVSISMTVRPPLSTTMPSLKIPVPSVTLTLQQAGLSARHCSRGVCVCADECVTDLFLSLTFICFLKKELVHGSKKVFISSSSQSYSSSRVDTKT